MNTDAAAGWATIALVLAMPLVFGLVAGRTRRAQARGATPPTGIVLGLDEVFHPTAYDARVEWDAIRTLPAPAPTPDRGPGVIEGGTHITIEV